MTALSYTNLGNGEVRCNETGNVIGEHEKSAHESAFASKQARHARAEPIIAANLQLEVAQKNARDATSLALETVAELKKARAELAALKPVKPAPVETEDKHPLDSRKK